MKKVLLNDTAQRMYVEDLMTFEAIAKELDVSERTVREWAKNGNWELKRKKYREFQESLHDDAREIATLLAQKIKEQLQSDQMPSRDLLNSFTKIAASMIRMRDYEKAISADEEASDAESEAAAKSQKNAAEIFKQTFGVDLTI
jgi:DNA-binding transcriptional MerR regulator